MSGKMPTQKFINGLWLINNVFINETLNIIINIVGVEPKNLHDNSLIMSAFNGEKWILPEGRSYLCISENVCFYFLSLFLES